MLACDEPRSTLQHESISAELHVLWAWRVSMLARASVGYADSGWGRGLGRVLGRLPGIARRRSAVNTGAAHEPNFTNAFQKTPFYFFWGSNHILKMHFLKTPFYQISGRNQLINAFRPSTSVFRMW